MKSSSNNKKSNNKAQVDASSSIATGQLWSQLDPSLLPSTLEAIKDLGFTKTTPVQNAAIPLLVTNKDVVAQAATGSGKTVAYLVPGFEILQRRSIALTAHQVGVIIIAPTRELATQIASVAAVFSRFAQNITTLQMIGGTEVEEDIHAFRSNGGNVIIATPGRLNDVMKRALDFNVKELELLVLDEADRLLDMGFQSTLNEILAKLPKQRRTGLFSATITADLVELARAGMRNPRQVRVTAQSQSTPQTQGHEQATPATLQNSYIICEQKSKFSTLIDVLNRTDANKIIVYVATCACVDYFAKIIELLPVGATYRILALHGKMVQKKRTKMFETFQNCNRCILLTTDVAARGLDVPDVDSVIQYDPPQNPDFFVHRVGRTARMGRSGFSLALLAPEEDTYLSFLSLRKIPMHPADHLPDQVKDVTEDVRALIKQDRDLHEKGQKAFVSFIRAYKEHHCNFIFRLPKLNIGGVATSFCLLKLPKMPEVKGVKIVDFVADPIDERQIPFKRAEREVARQKRIEVSAIEKEQEKRNKPDGKGENRIKSFHDEKMKKKKKQQSMEEDYDDDDDDDDDDFSKEAAALKKLKKRKLSQADFDKEFGYLEDGNNQGDDSVDHEDNKHQDKKAKPVENFDNSDNGSKKKKKNKNKNKKKKNGSTVAAAATTTTTTTTPNH